MKKVTSILGLADGADEEQITTAIRALQGEAGKVTPLTNRLTELTTERDTLAAEQIDSDLDGHGVLAEATRTALRPVLQPMKNRAARLGFLKDMGFAPKAATAAVAPTTGKAPLTNRATAKTPEADPATGEDAATARQSRRGNLIANRARELRGTDKKLSLAASYQVAETQVDRELATATADK